MGIKQTESVSKLSETMEVAKSLVITNTHNTQEAKETTKVIRAIAAKSNERMTVLLDSVTDIEEVSEHVSAITKTIDSIAFKQTSKIQYRNHMRDTKCSCSQSRNVKPYR